MEPPAGRGAKHLKQVRREAQHPPRLHAGQNHSPGVGWRGAPPKSLEWTKNVSQILAREGEVPVTFRNIHLCSHLCCKTLIRVRPFHPDLHRRSTQGHNKDEERVQFLRLPSIMPSFFLHPLELFARTRKTPKLSPNLT